LQATRQQEIETMSLNPENGSFGIPPVGGDGEVGSTVAVAEPVAPMVAVQPAYELPPPPQTPPWGAQVAVAPAQAPAAPRRRPRWIVPTGIAVIGLVAAGTLGGFLYTTIGQRDTARHQLTSTQATLTDAQKQLAARETTDAYVKLYLAYSGKVTTDYENLTACDSYVTCRVSGQALLIDIKAFQAARSSGVVPPALANANTLVGDSIGAAITADQELITGMDTNDDAKIKEGFKKVDAAMLSFANAESAIAANLG
jgi:hypothetical protein